MVIFKIAVLPELFSFASVHCHFFGICEYVNNFKSIPFFLLLLEQCHNGCVLCRKNNCRLFVLFLMNCKFVNGPAHAEVRMNEREDNTVRLAAQLKENHFFYRRAIFLSFAHTHKKNVFIKYGVRVCTFVSAMWKYSDDEWNKWMNERAGANEGEKCMHFYINVCIIAVLIYV